MPSILTSGTSGNGLQFTSAADGALTIKTSAADGTSVVDAIAISTTGVPTFAKAPVIPLSYIFLNTANGYGSTNTKIRRFTNTVKSGGSDITYADSSTLGATFTINTTGIYTFSYNDQFTSSSMLGFSLNSTQLTTSLQDITVADIMAVARTVAADLPACVSFTTHLSAGDVVRAHIQGTATGASTTLCQLSAARVG